MTFLMIFMLDNVAILIGRETILGRVSLRKSKIGFLNPKESENRFCVSLLNRSILDPSDHNASKEPKNPLSPF